jgi:mRNA interferase RelE/StbE
MAKVEYTEQAIDHLDALDPTVRERIVDKIDEATEWTEHRLKPLSGSEFYSLRAGDFRAIIDWDREEDVLVVVAVGHRRNVYDRHI